MKNLEMHDYHLPEMAPALRCLDWKEAMLSLSQDRETLYDTTQTVIW